MDLNVKDITEYLKRILSSLSSQETFFSGSHTLRQKYILPLLVLKFRVIEDEKQISRSPSQSVKGDLNRRY